MYKLIQKKRKKKSNSFSVLRTIIDVRSLVSPLYMDKWGVAESANEGTGGVWVKIVVTPALHHIRRSPYDID